jgi:hypothetical protein
MRRRPERWETRFGGWVGHVTVRGVVRELTILGVPVTPKGVYGWLAGVTVPRAERAMAMVKISRGRIRLEDVYRHKLEVRGDGDGGRTCGVAARTQVGTRRD